MNVTTDVISRLGDLGVDALESDTAVIYAIERAREQICNDINWNDVPEGLRYTFVNMACGFYLHDQKAMGLLDESVVSGGSVASISEGDVSISFDTGNDVSPDARFDALVQFLIHPQPYLLSRYRRLTW